MSLVRSLTHALHMPSIDATALRQWREQALTIILYGVVALGGLAVLSGILNALTRNRLDLAVMYGGVYLLVLIISFVPQVGFHVRGACLLAACFSVAAQDLFFYGFTSVAMLFLFATVLLAVLLFGWRLALSVLLLSLGTLSAAGWGLASGMIEIIVDPREEVTDPGELASQGIVFLLVSVMIGGAVLSLMAHLSQQTRAARVAQQQAEQQAATAAAAREQAEQQAIQLKQQRATLLRTEEQLRDLVATLETPTVTLAHGMLLAPIVGTIDSQRARRLTERLLDDVQRQHARSVVIDLAGVATIDTQVAQALITTARALHLLGCRVTLTGVAPHMADTLIKLGISLDGIGTAHSPQDVLTMHTSTSAKTNRRTTTR